MSATITTDIFCDSCQDWIHGITGDKAQVNTARRIARTQGWRCQRKPGGGQEPTVSRAKCDHLISKEALLDGIIDFNSILPAVNFDVLINSLKQYATKEVQKLGIPREYLYGQR